MFSTLRRSLLILLTALPLFANAAPSQSAHDLVDGTTKALLADLAAHKDQYKTNPSAFYDALNQIGRAHV